MIYGIGCDTVDVDRFVTKITTNQRLLQRLFTGREQDLPVRSLAARFAAKEALVKALGGSNFAVPVGGVGDEHELSLSWQDIEILPANGTKPEFSATPRLLEVFTDLGVTRAHLSLSHDGGHAVAVVVAEALPNNSASDICCAHAHPPTPKAVL
ncbi:holo-ACP synthase [Canibacter sp. lx-72]|uniref:holo-ACP synthase n=1 Tax=Canibacter zhuwentaonis TaxID=2837491 RepID=UPI001BDC58F2|nr:holo-ACP synthase [Canibacter zhuwentaonis]